MTDWFIGLEGKGEERIEENSPVLAWETGLVDPDLTRRHLLIVVVGAGEWIPSLDCRLHEGRSYICSLLSSQ